MPVTPVNVRGPMAGAAAAERLELGSLINEQQRLGRAVAELSAAVSALASECATQRTEIVALRSEVVSLQTELRQQFDYVSERLLDVLHKLQPAQNGP